MFDFGKDLGRLTGSGRNGRGDPRVLELLSPDMLAEQARAQANAARKGPGGWRNGCEAARLWMEHARRTGLRSGLKLATGLAEDAAACAPGASMRMQAELTALEARLTAQQMFGGDNGLAGAEGALDAMASVKLDGPVQAQVVAFHARLRGWKATMAQDGEQVRAAAALLDAALYGLKRLKSEPWVQMQLIEARRARAVLAAAAGVKTRDARLLDQAGRDLRGLIEAADADFMPLTRARAMRDCGSVLGALGELARQADSVEQALDLLSAAADLFTPDHSPLDHASILVEQAVAMMRLHRLRPEAGLMQGAGELLVMATRLTAKPGLVLRTEAEILKGRIEVMKAVHAGDMQALSGLEARLRHALAAACGVDPQDWAIRQLVLADIYDGLEDLGAAPSRRQTAAFARVNADEVMREVMAVG